MAEGRRDQCVAGVRPGRAAAREAGVAEQLLEQAADGTTPPHRTREEVGGGSDVFGLIELPQDSVDAARHVRLDLGAGTRLGASFGEGFGADRPELLGCLRYQGGAGSHGQ